MLIALAIPVILLAASLGGALRFRTCWRGLPIDKHPVCRRCRYDLIGSPKPYTTCPECGADLTARKSTAIGNRKRKPGPAVVAGFISLVSTALLATILFSVATRVNLNPHKPFWLLQLEATTPSLNSNGHELDELLARTKKGSLSAAQLDSLMDSVLQEQANTAIPWDETWGDLFAELFTQGVGTPQQHEQYALKIYEYQANTRPSIPIGYDVHVSARRTAKRGQGDKTHFYYAEYGDRIEIDGLTLDRTHHGRSGGGAAASGGSTGGGTGFHTNKPPFDQLQPGQYTITYVQPTEIHLGSASGPLIASFDRTANCPIEFLPADADEIELFKDPAAAYSLESFLSSKVKRIRITKNTSGSYAAFHITSAVPSIATFAYRISVSFGNKEWPTDLTYTHNGANHYHFGGHGLWPEALDADRVDLIFRPSPDAARGTPDVYRILDHEFTINDVEVVRYP